MQTEGADGTRMQIEEPAWNIGEDCMKNQVAPKRLRFGLLVSSALVVALLAGCSSSAAPGSPSASGGGTANVKTGGTNAGSGGATTAGGGTSSLGSTATGGATSPAGTAGGGGTSTGGVLGTAPGSGGEVGATGGRPTTGGVAAGGTMASGGSTQTGGTFGSGGASSTGRPDAATDSAQDVGAPDTRVAGGAEVGPSGEAGGSGGNGGMGPASFHCVNWADNRDNFVDGHLLLSGIISDTDTYDGVTTKANIVLGALVDLLKANSFRMPINEPTALDPWWNSYKAAIDAGIAKGMKVIIGFWAKDKGIGKPVDNTRWYAMWKVVIDAYVSNPLVFYDIHNEPHGFTPAQWVVQVNGWLAQFPNVPRQQIIVAGSGWDDNVANVASNWPDLMMEVHNYAYNGPTTTVGWNSNLLNRLGNAVSRTIVGEWAGQVIEDYTTGIEGNADKSFIVGTANTILQNKMGSCWWAGAFAPSGGTSGTTLLVQKGTGDSMTFTVNDQGTLSYLQHSWGLN